MAKAPQISDAEWHVMDVLWERSPLPAADVVDALADEQDWSPQTIKTLLRRLVDKGALTYEPQGNRYLYRPAVSRAACVRRESRSFLDRVFAGDRAAMLTHLVEQSRLSDEQIEQLRQILERKGDKS